MKLNKTLCSIALTFMMAAPAIATQNGFPLPDELKGLVGSYLKPREAIKMSEVYKDAGYAWGTQHEVFNVRDFRKDPRNIMDEDLFKITKAFPNITYLDLFYCKNITNAGLAHIRGLTNLTDLNLWGCSNITDAGLVHIKDLTNLTDLNLRGCSNITDAGLGHIRDLTQLTNLNLSDCHNITDAGLAHISVIVQLTHLNLTWCANITDAGLAHIRAALPDCRINC